MSPTTSAKTASAIALQGPAATYVVAVEVETLCPGRGWEWSRKSFSSEHEAHKWCNRKKRSHEYRELCVVVSESTRVFRLTIKSRWGHKVMAPPAIRALADVAQRRLAKGARP